MGEEDCCATQLIDGDGVFNVAGLDAFMKKAKVADCGLSYTVVAIMGPQSSELCMLSASMSTPWVMIGDFNDVLAFSERIGGTGANYARIRCF
ncbi:hypothetical protein K1719_027944 [Acacia pycnantha]|nr:hypothetical protein K1719_027944 [Acacia pycnantha]